MSAEHRLEYDVLVGGRTVKLQVRCADQPVALEERLLLLTFAGSLANSLDERPYCIAADAAVAAGHMAASFDLPNHGTRTEPHGKGIKGFANAVRHGEDPFAEFVEEAKAAVAVCLREELVLTGRIVVSGTSRGGYMALRLLAAEPAAIARAAVFAPVTDWNDLTEFADMRNTEQVDRLRLSNFAEAMTGKPIYMPIGYRDTRVSTYSCCKFYTRLMECEQDHGIGEAASQVQFYRTEDVGHTVSEGWYAQGARYLLEDPS